MSTAAALAAAPVETTPGNSPLTFEDTDFYAAELRMKFASAKEEFDPRTALALYLNPQLNTWADQFSDPVDRAILKAMRDRLDGATHTHNEAWEYISGAVDRLPCACGPEHDPANRQCPGKVTASADTVKRHIRKLAKYGVAQIQANNNRTREGSGGRLFSTSGRGGRQSGTDEPNTITFNMGRVLKIRNGWDEAARKRTVETWTEPWDARVISGSHKPKLKDDSEQTKLQGSSTPLAGVKQGSSTPIPLTLESSKHSNTSKANPNRGTRPGKSKEVEVNLAPSVRGGISQIVTSAAQPSVQPGDPRQWDKNPGDRNTVTFWVSGGQGKVWTHDKPRPKRVDDFAKTVVLTPDESSFMWNRWPKGFPQEQIEFLRMPSGARVRAFEDSDQVEAARAERKAAVKASFNPTAVLISARRGLLLDSGVTDEEIDKRISDEWSGLSGLDLDQRLKVWLNERLAA